MITEERFTVAMRAAVADRGEYWVYPQLIVDGEDESKFVNEDDEWHDDGMCIYVHEDGTPACLIGLALSKIDPELLPAYGSHSNACPATELLRSLGAEDRVCVAASVAQAMQDAGRTWGYALRRYESVFHEF